jgi:DNA topoisomerase II
MPPKYTHLSQRNQILKRPGQHIGSIKSAQNLVWLVDEEGDSIKIVEKEVTYNHGLIHIFSEVLSNAQDNFFRSQNSENPLKKIEVTVDKEKGEITVWNDGQHIPCTIHEWEADEEKIDNNDHYQAEIIFGHLNSSGNYDDDNETGRIGGGLHGVGVKLTNIFSQYFKVESFDPENGLKFVGEWSDNMSSMKKPKVTSLKQKKGYTCVTYIADFQKFGVKGYTDIDIAIMKKLCVDCAMITGQKVTFNSEVIPVKDLLGYVKMYCEPTNYVEFKTADSTVVLCEKPTFDIGMVQISFVNGINTKKGGVHVDEWKKGIFKPLLEKLKAKYTEKKSSTPFKITPKNLEQYFMLFITCNLKNPDFEGQTKDVLSNPSPKVQVPETKIKQLLKWDFISDIEETVRIQGMKELKKTDGKKTTSVDVPKADDANKAGTVNSHKCVLFITEGDSAKTFAIKGISAMEEGTNWFGALPVRGKVLNVRGASAKQINDNKEITYLKKMLGLEHGEDYSGENIKKLRYGKVCILTDADPDGDHIKGLIINFFQYFYPSLISSGYLTSLRTPIVKTVQKGKVQKFYYLKEFKEWASNQKTPFQAKYYKGLATSSDEDILDIFKDPHYVQYIEDAKSTDTIGMVFDKTRANDRKKWLENYTNKEFVYKMVGGEELVPITEFFNNEMIEFSIYDNHRSIPSVIDGLKPSQRKALFVGLKVLTKSKDYRVSQFAAEVAKLAKYHHGEISMEKTIVSMAQTFVGSNNATVFHESGQFGTRSSGGDDAGSSRYIATKLTNIARYLFREEDDPILEYLDDEGSSIEPAYYVPIIPYLLVNGCQGIGSGYSTFVPAYNPNDLIRVIKEWLAKKNVEKVDIKPWYRGFTGNIEKSGEKFIYHGVYSKVSDNCYQITELPIGYWTDDYKEYLNKLKTGVTSTKLVYDNMTVAELKEVLAENELPVGGKKVELINRLKQMDKDNGVSSKKMANTGQLISKYELYGSAYTIDIKVWTKPNVKVDEDVLNLNTTHALTNMTAFTPTGGIKKYNTLTEMVNTYCDIRYEYYEKRKKHLLRILKEKLAEYESKTRFISEALKNFMILKQPEEKLFEYFEENKYYKKNDSFTYLTDIPVRNFTTDKYEELLNEIKKIKAEIAYIKEKTPSEMWIKELDEFSVAYDKWLKEIAENQMKLSKQKIKSKRVN